VLPEFLSQHPEIAADVATHTVPLDPALISRDTRRRRLGALIGDLVTALQQGDVPEHLRTDGDGDIRERELLRHEILEKLEQNRLDAPSRELKVLSDWVWLEARRHLRTVNTQQAELLDLCPEAAMIVSPDGRMKYVNRAAAQIIHAVSGLPRDHILGKTPRELGFLVEAGPSSAPEFETLARTNTVAEALVSGRWHELRVREVGGLEGTDRAFGFALTDIHDRKAGAVRLEMLSKLSRLVGTFEQTELWRGFAQVPIPQLADWCAVSVIVDRVVQTSFIAQRDPSKIWLRRALRHAAKDLVHHPLWRDLLATGFQLLSEVSPDLLRMLLPNEADYKLVAQVGIRSLLVVPVVSRGEPLAIVTFAYTTESGRRYGKDDPVIAFELALHAAHIAENARLVTEAKANDARFRIALADARTIVYEQDEKLRYTWGYGLPFSMAGKIHADELPPDEAAALTRLKQGVIDTGVPVCAEIELTISGERRCLRENIEAVRDPKGRPVGVIGAATDLTEEKRTQQALKNAVEVRDQLIGIVGHDLRTPLSTMAITIANLRQSQEVSVDMSRVISRLERAVQRMTEMIDTLLDFTRVRITGKPLPTDRQPCDLADVVRDIVDEAASASPGQPITLEIRGDTRGTCDARRLAEALANLLSNALRYGDSTRPIDVSLEGDEGSVVIRVHNDGPPIPDGLLPVLFEPFARGHPDVASHHGLGLGLFVVKEIVTSHGGTVEVESTAQTGTTFAMRLPRTIGQPLGAV
jgi:signal transduction histidine kinase